MVLFSSYLNLAGQPASVLAMMTGRILTVLAMTSGFLFSPAESRAEASSPVTFERDVLPVLTRAGCNAGACHGKARGQNGFQLSLLGHDADFDYAALTREARGRRVFPAAPEFSLLLRKPAGQVPHGGGRRLEPGSAGYGVLLRWVSAGTPRQPAGAPA